MDKRDLFDYAAIPLMILITLTAFLLAHWGLV